jgi:hypothetical protein
MRTHSDTRYREPRPDAREDRGLYAVRIRYVFNMCSVSEMMTGTFTSWLLFERLHANRLPVAPQALKVW